MWVQEEVTIMKINFTQHDIYLITCEADMKITRMKGLKTFYGEKVPPSTVAFLGERRVDTSR